MKSVPSVLFRRLHLHSGWRLRGVLAALVCLTPVVRGTDAAQLKLHGRWTNPAGGMKAGSSVALSSRYAVLGAPQADEQATDQGAVQVFSATTGAWVRKLLPPAPAAAGTLFGSAVGISGNVVVVGARGTAGNKGAAHVYDVSTGARRWTLTAGDGSVGDQLGTGVAISGNTVAVGAPYAGGRGAVYLYRLTTGEQFGKVLPTDAALSQYFGTALAIDGNLLAVGSPGLGGNEGACHLIDLTTQNLVVKHVPPGADSGDGAGISIAMHGGKVVMGNLKASNGEVYVFDVSANTSDTLTPADGAVEYFGHSVAISGNLIVAGAPDGAMPGSIRTFDAATGTQLSVIPPTGETGSFSAALAMLGSTLLVGDPEDATQGFNAGAGHLLRPVTQLMPYTKVMARGDFAPGVPEGTHGVLGNAFINGDGEVAFTSRLTGPPSNGGRDTGFFNDLPGAMKLVVKSRDTLQGTTKIGTITNLAVNQPNLAVALLSLTGPGINAANSQCVLFSTDLTPGVALIAGSTAIPQHPGVVMRRCLELSQSVDFTGDGAFALACTLQQQPVTVLPTSDSAIVFIDLGNTDESVREGANAPTSPVTQYGQITGRVSTLANPYTWSAALSGDTAANAAIFRKVPGSMATLVARKGNFAGGIPGAPPPTLSTFIGETQDSNEMVIYRATLKGPGVTSINNEGLWSRTTSNVTSLKLRKGQSVPGLTGVSIARIIQFWPSGSLLSHVMALVQLRGTGVTAANDQALVLMQGDGPLLVLMREGEPASGCTPATIRTISRVEVSGYPGTYAILATLAGAPTGTDLALYTGNTLRGGSADATTLRRPFLRLRKGQLYDNQPGTLKSISLPTGTVTPGGAGVTGRGRATGINQDFVLTVEFANRVRQIMKGQIY